MTAPNWARLAGRTISNNSTSILSATAVAGVVATAVLTARAQKRVEIVLQSNMGEPPPAEVYSPGISKEKMQAYIKLFWKDYIPPAVAGLATIACIVGANQIGLRRQAAMLGAYTLVDGAFRQYKDEVISQFGETKERKVVDEIAARQIDENPPDSQIILVGGGEQLCYDTLSGRYFHSDAETIRQAALNVNESIIKDMWASLNEFYGYLGLDSTVLGEEMGFNLDHLIDLEFTSHLAQGKTPCLAITHKSLPVADYGKIC